MRIAIIGQQDFGKATLEAFLNRGDTVAAVFCAPEKGPPRSAARRGRGTRRAGAPVPQADRSRRRWRRCGRRTPRSA